MKIKEHDNSRSFKAPSDVERYLIRIIQRYFDVENAYSNESVEAMVIESLTRLKRDFMAKKGFVFHLNQKTGHLVLNIADFNGEPEIDKKTAFNKDFGADEGFVVSGDDERLSDDREPLEHVHVIGDIQQLVELLERAGLPEAAHGHRNRNLLEMITYAGVHAEIDLIVIENLYEQVEHYIENLSVIRRGLTLSHTQDMKPLTDHLNLVRDHMITVRDALNNFHAWVDDAKRYTDLKIQGLKTYLNDAINRCLTEEDIQDFYTQYSNFTYLAEEGEIPIPDGTVELSAEYSQDISAGDGDSSSLEAIYNNGNMLGDENWLWDATTSSFVYQANDYSYSMFLSQNAYQDYTHRVVLKSSASDNDIISVVLAYDKDTNSHLSLVCATGGLKNSITGTSTTCAAVVKNFYDGMTGNAWTTINPIGNLYYKLADVNKNWNAITNGISVLVKRTGNTFKIWALYNQVHNWHVTNANNRMDIATSTAPIIEFNLTDYPDLHVFADKACQYGYGCFSQDKSTYADVFYYAPLDTGGIGDIQGHTTVYRILDMSHSPVTGGLAETLNGNTGKAKLFFRYDEDEEQVDGSVVTKTITVPFPIIMLKENKTSIIMQDTCFNDGSFDCKINVMHTVPDYLTPDNIYNNKEIVLASTNRMYFSDLITKIRSLSQPYSLCLIEDQSKFDFVQNLLKDDEMYFFQALYRLSPSGTEERPYEWIDDTMQPLPFFDWASGHPVEEGIMTAFLQKEATWKMYSDYLHGGEARGCVVQCPIKHLSDYFKNPRIYYQIYGEKEQ